MSTHSVETLGPALQKRLDEAEHDIEDGLHAYARVGRRLREIRDDQLYRAAGYPSFNAYAEQRWELSRSRAYQLIDASEIAEVLSTNVDYPPKHEAHVRELVPLRNDEAELILTWRTLQEEHGDDLTAEHVRQAVEAKLRRDRKQDTREQRRTEKIKRKTADRLGAWELDTLSIQDAASGEWPASGRIDAIITDPPYDREALPLYQALAHFAARVLKPGGDLVVMAGQSYLPDVLHCLHASQEMTYRWTLAYLTPGGQAVQVWERRVNTFWKPVIWLTKGHRTDGDWVGDVARSPTNDNDKRFHRWGQSVSGMNDLLQRFTDAGDQVCDPFCGGGSVGIAACLTGRSFYGIDNDLAAVETTQDRLRALDE